MITILAGKEYNMTPVFLDGTPSILTDVGNFIQSAISWMGQFLSEITSDTSKILVTFVVALPLCGLGISLLQRLLSTRA